MKGEFTRRRAGESLIALKERARERERRAEKRGGEAGQGRGSTRKERNGMRIGMRILLKDTIKWLELKIVWRRADWQEFRMPP